MGGANATPDGLVSSVALASSFVDINDSLAEVPLCCLPIVDALESQNGLIFVLLNLGPALVGSLPSEAHELGTDPQSDWLTSTLADLLRLNCFLLSCFDLSNLTHL